MFVGLPDAGTLLVHAENLTCSVPPLCSGSSCCVEYLWDFVMIFNQYCYLHTNTRFPNQNISLAITAAGKDQMCVRGSIVNVSVFVVVISFQC